MRSSSAGARKYRGSRRFILASLSAVLSLGTACSILTTRPVQLMSDTSAALKAAREVQADTVAPELYRQASEWFSKARQEYKFKNYKQATEYAEKARFFAERAEFQAIRNGAKAADPPAPEAPAAPVPYDYPTPQPTPFDPMGASSGPSGGGSGQPPAQLGPLPTPGGQ